MRPFRIGGEPRLKPGHLRQLLEGEAGIEGDARLTQRHRDGRRQASDVRLKLRVAALEIGGFDPGLVHPGDEGAGAEEQRLPSGRERQRALIRRGLRRLRRSGGGCQQQRCG